MRGNLKCKLGAHGSEIWDSGEGRWDKKNKHSQIKNIYGANASYQLVHRDLIMDRSGIWVMGMGPFFRSQDKNKFLS